MLPEDVYCLGCRHKIAVRNGGWWDTRQQVRVNLERGMVVIVCRHEVRRGVLCLTRLEVALPVPVVA